MGGSLATESFARLDAVLEAVLSVVGVADAAPLMVCGVDEADWGAELTMAVGIASPIGEGRVSLLAAQAIDVRRARETSTDIDEYLLNKVRCISC
jgi:hypothetical protein